MSAVDLKPSAFEQLLDCVISKNRLLRHFSTGSHEPAFRWESLDSDTEMTCPLPATQLLPLLVCPAALDRSALFGLLCAQL